MRSIYIKIEVPDNFEERMDMQAIVEKEVFEDRWSWHSIVPPEKFVLVELDDYDLIKK